MRMKHGFFKLNERLIVLILRIVALSILVLFIYSLRIYVTKKSEEFGYNKVQAAEMLDRIRTKSRK
jgi:hypothetical protein